MSHMKNQKRSSGRGCLFLIVGTLLILLLMALYIFAVGRITAAVIEARTGSAPAYAVLTAQIPCIVVAFVLLEGILVLQYLPSQEEYDRNNPSAVTPERRNRFWGTRRSTNLLSLILLLLVVVCGAVSVNTYRVVSEDGITTSIFGFGHSYSWEDVTDCQVDCSTDEGLSLTFTMSDGKEFEILQNTVSDNAAFAEKYGSPGGSDSKQTATLAFSVDVCRRLESRGITRRVYHRERTIRFYKDKYPDQWTYVSELINYREIRPSEDETVAETASP